MRHIEGVKLRLHAATRVPRHDDPDSNSALFATELGHFDVVLFFGVHALLVELAPARPGSPVSFSNELLTPSREGAVADNHRFVRRPILEAKGNLIER